MPEPYICRRCHHALTLHERDEENRLAACCVEGCTCGHGELEARRAVLEQIATQPAHRKRRREMYEGLHRIPTSGSTGVDSIGMLPGYSRRKR